MKRIKYWVLTAIALLVVFVSVCPVNTVYALNSKTEIYGMAQSGYVEKWYSALSKANANGAKFSISVSKGDEKKAESALTTAWYAYMHDHPEMAMWSGTMYHYTTLRNFDSKTGKGTMTAWLCASESYSSSDYSSAITQAKKVVSLAPKTSRYATIKYLHDYLVKNTTYTFRGSNKRTNHQLQTAIGPLVYGKGVCAGYSDAFKLMCNYAGIPCFIVGNNSHQWNYVQMEDGKWYCMDVTWDDPLGCSKSNVSYTYFLVKTPSDKDHSLTSLAVPFPVSKSLMATSAYKASSDEKNITLGTPQLTGAVCVDGGVRVNWGKVSGSSRYKVFRKSGTSGWTALGTTTGTTYTDTSVKSGTKYTYTVRCVTSDGKAYTSYYDKTGKSVVYMAMPRISKTENVVNGVKLTWGSISNAKKYRVYRKSGLSGWSQIAEVQGTTYTDITAKSNTSYTYTIRSSDSYGNLSTYNGSGWSIKFISAPKLKSVSNVNGGVFVSWDKVAGAGKYRVFYKTWYGNWVSVGDTTGTSYTVKGLKTGTTYTFTVRCLDSNGRSYISGYNGTGFSIKYVAAPVLKSITANGRSITVSWNKVSGVANYRVYYKVNNGNWVFAGNSTGSSYTINGLTKGKTYTVTVRCVSKDGRSILSGYDATGLVKKL